MDMYRILENFDAVNNKKTLTEGAVKRELHAMADKMTKAEFVAKANEHGMGAKEAAEFWNTCKGEDDEELDEGFLGFGMPKFKVDMDRSAHAGGLLDITGSERDGKKVMAALQKANPELAAQGRHIGGSGLDGYIYYGIAFPSTALAQQAAAALGGVAEDQELDEERRTDADWDDAAIQAGKRGRDARDDPSRHAARAKAGQAMRGNAKPDFLDLDRDGDKTEPMKGAAKGVAEGMLTHRDFEKPDDVDVQKMAKMAAKGLLTYATKTKMNPANLLKKDYYALAAMLEKVNPNLYAAIDDQLSDNDYNWLYFKAADLAANAAAKQGVAEAGKAPFPGTPEYELRFGKDDASSAFDKKKISTGTVYSRKHFDEPEAGDDDTPKSAGRPKGTGRKLGAKGPSVASKLLKGKGGLKEHDDEIDIADRGEYDQEGEMARQDLHTMVDAARELHAILGSDENLPEWVQSKITKALDYIDTARDYMQSVDAERGEEVNEIAPLAAVAGALGRAAVTGAASGAVQSAMGDEEVDEASTAPAPHGFKKGDEVIFDGRKRGTIVGVGNEQSPGGTNTVYIQFPGVNGAAAYNSQDVKLASAAPSFKRGDKVTVTWKGKTHPGYTYIRPLDGDPTRSYATSPGGADELWPTDSYTPAGVAEADYSAKSARAGKDIGKPGKNFSKIARGAAERYGSKAAGERVAGAVLNKLRHPTKEGAGDLRSSVLSVIQHIYDGASAGEEMVDDVASELGQYFSQVKKSTDKTLRKAYQLMSREGAEAEGDPEYMAQMAKQAIDLLSQPAVAEESGDKKDPPFAPDTKSSFKKSTNPNRTNRDSVKALAQKGLADMTTAELKSELKRREKVDEMDYGNDDEKSPSSGHGYGKRKPGAEVTVAKDQALDKKSMTKKASAALDDATDKEKTKDKKKEVEETTVSGSVAPAAGGDAPKSKNGMQFGKGVYEGQLDELDKSTLGSYVKKSKVDMVKGALAGASGAAAGDSGETDKAQKQVLKRNSGINKAIDRLTKEGVYEGQVAESFEKKLGSILNEGMSVNVSTDDTGKKSISVNATDADADALGDMLKMAGLFSSEGYSRACTNCGGIHEAGACGADMVEEELANSPDEVYTDADYMTQTLSGGLNGPKTTGQTTGAVVNRQDSRQGVMAEAGKVTEQAESRLWNLYKQYEKK